MPPGEPPTINEITLRLPGLVENGIPYPQAVQITPVMLPPPAHIDKGYYTQPVDSVPVYI